jgi:lysophospholipase L1-like esterase
VISPTAIRRFTLRSIVVALSMLAGLALAELAAGALAGFAYPFLNVFVADSDYGVRLAPHSATRTVSRDGHVTAIAINAQGFRGPDWTPAAVPLDAPAAVVPGRVMLLGDSQIFSYGVDEPDGLAAALTRALPPGAEVLNAAVPTWGPPESVRALEALAPTYRPETVVFAANLANDWTEVRVPNARRTTARDGFAAYRLHGAPEAADFPGRAWLFGRSHLFVAVRRLFAAATERPPETAAAARRLLADLPQLSRPDGPHRSRMTAPLLAAAATCQRLGCRVVLLALPLDLQVHPSEWAKYRTAPFDLRPTEVLLDQLLADAARHGIAAVDLRPTLRAASPGAFLPDDYHLSAAGHAAVARALAPAITATAAPTLAAESAR